MRSCSSAPTRSRSIFSLEETENRMPRSILRTPPSPQLRAMSVALDDHGEMVPSRGTTRNSSPAGSPAGGVP